MRESPALKIIRPCARSAPTSSTTTPTCPSSPSTGCARSSSTRSSPSADLACVVTAHPEIDYERVVAEAPLVLDFRGVTRDIRAENLVRL